MASRFRSLGYFTSCAVILLAMVTAGCAHRYYDAADHNDYHRWNGNEWVYYNQWVVESHGAPHRDYRHLSKGDQKRYWDWRHNHDHDHDRDHR
jgi:hypothetical protein